MERCKKIKAYSFLIVATIMVIGTRTANAQATGFVGEIRMFAGNYAPLNWALCDGSLLTIASNPTLFSILGTTYGGNGSTTFALPDLRGRFPVGTGSGTNLTIRTLGSMGGEESHTLTVSEIPSHSHLLYADTTIASSDTPLGRFPARNAAGIPQFGSTGNVLMSTASIGSNGGSQPHNTMPPYTCINYIICVSGTFPSR